MRIAVAAIVWVGLSWTVAAQEAAIRGVVTDESGGVIPAAKVTVRDAAGTPLSTLTAGPDGTFELTGLTPGQYSVLGESEFFEAAQERLSVRPDGSSGPVRLVLEIAGLVQSLVVTGARVETRMAETPKKIHRGDRQQRHRADRGGGFDRCPEEELRRGRDSVPGCAVGRRYSRLPP